MRGIALTAAGFTCARALVAQVLRVWDLLFAEGQPVLIHVCVALFTLHEAQLLAADELYSIKPVLKGNDADEIVREVLRRTAPVSGS